MGITLDRGAFLKAVSLSRPFLELAALVDVTERAERIAAHASALAPEGTPEEGDPHPGAMKADIGIKGRGIDSKGPFVDVGTREPYGLYVEFGTVNIRAQPFMRPAIAAESGKEMSTRIALAPRKRRSKK